nr:MAG TPA: hypothetical protein [Caudoviricetes sp.]
MRFIGLILTPNFRKNIKIYTSKIIILKNISTVFIGFNKF